MVASALAIDMGVAPPGVDTPAVRRALPEEAAIAGALRLTGGMLVVVFDAEGPW
jgi:D-serine deaminase-like pyridoxal phosphate-dependent protein